MGPSAPTLSFSGCVCRTCGLYLVFNININNGIGPNGIRADESECGETPTRNRQVQPRESGYVGALCGHPGQRERIRSGGQSGCPQTVPVQPRLLPGHSDITDPAEGLDQSPAYRLHAVQMYD